MFFGGGRGDVGTLLCLPMGVDPFPWQCFLLLKLQHAPTSLHYNSVKDISSQVLLLCMNTFICRSYKHCVPYDV